VVEQLPWIQNANININDEQVWQENECQLTGLRVDMRVLLAWVDKVRLVMKFPRAKLESVAGITRRRDMS
jgi:hypothetical protein